MERIDGNGWRRNRLAGCRICKFGLYFVDWALWSTFWVRALMTMLTRWPVCWSITTQQILPSHGKDRNA